MPCKTYLLSRKLARTLFIGKTYPKPSIRAQRKTDDRISRYRASLLDLLQKG